MTGTYAVIDIGTLKVKFLIATVTPVGNLNEKYSSSTLTCFGCDMDANGRNVKEEFLNKTIKELKRCKALLKKHKVTKHKVVSTHAMRRAKNRRHILKRIKEEVGFDVENITQKQEAELFFKAALRDFGSSSEKYCVLDIGGGSVQILIGTPKKLHSVHMMQTGAQYLHDNFTRNSSSPKSFTTLSEIENMRDLIIKELLPLRKNLKTPVVYGSTNIIDLLKAIKLPMEKHANSKSHPYQVYTEHFEDFIGRMLAFPYHRRESMFDFQKGYMWGIDKAFLNVVTIAKHLKAPYIIPSNANIAKGFIYEMIED